MSHLQAPMSVEKSKEKTLFAKLKRLTVAAFANCLYYPEDISVFSLVVIWLKIAEAVVINVPSASKESL